MMVNDFNHTVLQFRVLLTLHVVIHQGQRQATFTSQGRQVDLIPEGQQVVGGEATLGEVMRHLRPQAKVFLWNIQHGNKGCLVISTLLQIQRNLTNQIIL